MSKPDKTQVDWSEARRVADASIAMAAQIIAAVNDSMPLPDAPGAGVAKKNLLIVRRNRQSVQKTKPD